MKLEAKTRLMASTITAGAGDAKPIRKTFLKFGRALKTADKHFDKYVVATNKDREDADDHLLDAGDHIQNWVDVNFDMDAFEKIPGVTDSFSDTEEGSHDIYGTLEIEFGKHSVSLDYDLNLNEPKKHEVNVTIDRKEFNYVWASGKFDLVKYEKMVNKALDHFEKEGFGGPKK